jgi:hypothetical protein
VLPSSSLQLLLLQKTLTVDRKNNPNTALSSFESESLKSSSRFSFESRIYISRHQQLYCISTGRVLSTDEARLQYEQASTDHIMDTHHQSASPVDPSPQDSPPSSPSPENDPVDVPMEKKKPRKKRKPTPTDEHGEKLKAKPKKRKKVRYF